MEEGRKESERTVVSSPLTGSSNPSAGSSHPGVVVQINQLTNQSFKQPVMTEGRKESEHTVVSSPLTGSSNPSAYPTSGTESGASGGKPCGGHSNLSQLQNISL